ncbi:MULTISPECIES: isocitrate lyase/PEP mutase family protein [Paraburkholderia]|uniref:isocitrate lyase/PEP mutase family protein n=1 Tax=Paraburkholderia TaxID=1822464 RepID=UPI000B3FA35B|nr:isocitrate lyase/phosphoenolpyruvate mutase family protein [Paraburkholderia caledonica]
MTDIVTNFRKLHDNTAPLRLPNAWDAGSARLFESLGATAIATTSAGVAWSLGYADGRGLPTDEVVDAASRMIRVVDVPLSFDVENGYSDNPKDVVDTVMRLVDLGLAGINIEDGPDQPSLLASKIEAIRNAVSRANLDLFVNARSDVFLAQLAEPDRLVEESIRRGKLYAAAGADCLFLPAISTPVDITEVIAEIPIPLNVMAVPGLPASAELGKLGVRRLSAGSGISQALWGHAEQLARGFLQEGNSDPLFERAMTYSALQNLFT